MELDKVLLSLRNDLVCFWHSMVATGTLNWQWKDYAEYCKALDLLDPDLPNHLDSVGNAISLYRMTIVSITETVVLKRQEMTANQQVLQTMKLISLQEERMLEAAHSC